MAKNDGMGSGDSLIAISVIMPVYNSVEYVEAAARSVLDQDLENIELILVDDGSTDGSGSVCDALQRADSRVRVIHQSNGGVCRARNAGISVAQGQYITFCDNDDLMLPGCLSENWALANQINASCVRFARRREVVVGTETVSSSTFGPAEDAAFGSNELADYYDELGQGVWTGLYRADIVRDHKIRFDEEVAGGNEDTLFNLSFWKTVYQMDEQVYLNSSVLYVWVQRSEHSTSFVPSPNRVVGLRKALIAEVELLRELGILSGERTRSARIIAGYARRAYGEVYLANPHIRTSDLIKFNRGVTTAYRRIEEDIPWGFIGRFDGILLRLILDGRYHAIALIYKLGRLVTRS